MGQRPRAPVSAPPAGLRFLLRLCQYGYRLLYPRALHGIPSLFRGNERIQEAGYATDSLFQREAIRFIDQNKSRPFFLDLGWNAPHIASTFDKKAREVPEEYLKMYREILGPDASKPLGSMRMEEYMGLITHLDTAIGAVLQRLKDHGIEDNPMIPIFEAM